MITIIGLYNYDNSIFDTLQLPEDVSKETLTNNIMMTCGDMETFIPDPAIMKNAIGYWSAAHLDVWQHLVETTQYDYNPIWNKDGTITETETRNLAGTDNNTETRNLAGSDSNTETRNLAGSDNSTETRNLAGNETRNLAGSTDKTVTTKTNAYNGGGMTDRDQTIEDADTTDTGTIGTTDTGTIGNQRTTSDTGTISKSRTEQGNIGITSTQQLIKEEREIAEFNIYEYITQSFKERFCIMVY
jgi:hypothetical protein